jgi:hypothetical protein
MWSRNISLLLLLLLLSLLLLISVSRREFFVGMGEDPTDRWGN